MPDAPAAAAAPNAWERGAPNDLALLATPAAHYSLARAAGILVVTSPATTRATLTDTFDRVAAVSRELTADRGRERHGPRPRGC